MISFCFQWQKKLEFSQKRAGFTVLKLPSSTRNIQTKMNKSTTCVLSAKNVYAIAGTKKQNDCSASNFLFAHFTISISNPPASVLYSGLQNKPASV